MHLLLDRDAASLHAVDLAPQVHLHRIDSRPGRALAAVRPDGHVGFRCGEADPDQLMAWLELVGAA